MNGFNFPKKLFQPVRMAICRHGEDSFLLTSNLPVWQMQDKHSERTYLCEKLRPLAPDLTWLASETI